MRAAWLLSFGRKRDQNRQLSFQWKFLILIGHYCMLCRWGKQSYDSFSWSNYRCGRWDNANLVIKWIKMECYERLAVCILTFSLVWAWLLWMLQKLQSDNLNSKSSKNSQQKAQPAAKCWPEWILTNGIFNFHCLSLQFWSVGRLGGPRSLVPGWRISGRTRNRWWGRTAFLLSPVPRNACSRFQRWTSTHVPSAAQSFWNMQILK